MKYQTTVSREVIESANVMTPTVVFKDTKNNKLFELCHQTKFPALLSKVDLPLVSGYVVNIVPEPMWNMVTVYLNTEHNDLPIENVAALRMECLNLKGTVDELTDDEVEEYTELIGQCLMSMFEFEDDENEE